MNVRNFRQMLEAQWAKDNFVCVGLDSEFNQIKQFVRGGYDGNSFYSIMLNFSTSIINATKDLVCAYKPNIAFYEAYGSDGLKVLNSIIQYIRDFAPDIPVILDAKRADIGNTNLGYAQLAFDSLRADAITVHPYLGAEALKPFLEKKNKGIIVLCRTSNPGAGEFQDLIVTPHLEEAKRWGIAWDSSDRGSSPCWIIDKMPLYQYIAYRVSREWNKNGNCALVVGATYPDELKEVRKIVGDMPVLIPGIGAQGGDVGKTVTAGKDSNGRGMIINSSRGIIFASSGEDFAEAARRETLRLNDLINRYR